LTGGGRDLCGEIGFLLFNSFAECVAHEPVILIGPPTLPSASFKACATVFLSSWT